MGHYRKLGLTIHQWCLEQGDERLQEKDPLAYREDPNFSNDEREYEHEAIITSLNINSKPLLKYNNNGSNSDCRFIRCDN